MCPDVFMFGIPGCPGSRDAPGHYDVRLVCKFLKRKLGNGCRGGCGEQNCGKRNNPCKPGSIARHVRNYPINRERVRRFTFVIGCLFSAEYSRSSENQGEKDGECGDVISTQIDNRFSSLEGRVDDLIGKVIGIDNQSRPGSARPEPCAHHQPGNADQPSRKCLILLILPIERAGKTIRPPVAGPARHQQRHT